MSQSKIIRRETGAPLTEPQQNKLNAITKIIEFAISGKGVCVNFFILAKSTIFSTETKRTIWSR